MWWSTGKLWGGELENCGESCVVELCDGKLCGGLWGNHGGGGGTVGGLFPSCIGELCGGSCVSFMSCVSDPFMEVRNPLETLCRCVGICVRCLQVDLPSFEHTHTHNWLRHGQTNLHTCV